MKALINDSLTTDKRRDGIRRGKWLKYGYVCKCSACGYDTGFAGTVLEIKLKYEFQFCPRCGAELNGEKIKELKGEGDDGEH